MGKNKLLIIFLILFLLVAATALLFKRTVNQSQYQPVLVPQNSPSIKIGEAALTPTEEQKILSESEKIVKGWQIKDLQFKVEIKKQAGNYLRVLATPLNQTLDPLTIIFEKTSSGWQYKDMGTAFPDLETQLPELFTE